VWIARSDEQVCEHAGTQVAKRLIDGVDGRV